MKHLQVGIDPGVSTGFAVWDRSTHTLRDVATLGICAAMLRVRLMQEVGSLHSVTFEDARMRTWFGSKGTEALMGAGSIRRDCSVWAEFLGEIGAAYKNVSPQQKGAKVDAPMFARLTGWQGRTSEHARDAAMLVLGATKPARVTA